MALFLHIIHLKMYILLTNKVISFEELGPQFQSICTEMTRHSDFMEVTGILFVLEDFINV